MPRNPALQPKNKLNFVKKLIKNLKKQPKLKAILSEASIEATETQNSDSADPNRKS